MCEQAKYYSLLTRAPQSPPCVTIEEGWVNTSAGSEVTCTLTILIVTQRQHQLVTNLAANLVCLSDVSRQYLTSAYCGELNPFFLGASENP